MAAPTSFDLQAHRGGMGLAPENSLEAFGNALTLGVTTLELDVQISRDGRPLVSHDRTLADGEFLAWLTREEVPSLCTLDEVFALTEERGADVRFNIETKFDVLHPDEVAPRERFVDVVADHVAPYADRVAIQSFDWAVLDLISKQVPDVQLNVLTNVAYWEVGKTGASPWMAGVDIDDFGGSVVAAASGRGYDAISPAFKLVTPAFVAEAHAADLTVIPYTVDEAGELEALLDLGCDGVITNRPDTARAVLDSRGWDLPTAFPADG